MIKQGKMQTYLNMQVVVQKLLTNYQVSGKGKPLVLLHGWGASLQSFQSILPELQKHYQVYAFDLPGFGATQIPTQDWCVDDYAAFTRAFFKKMEIKKTIFLGHSFGGRVLIKLASQEPDLFEKLILTGSAGIKPKETIKKKSFKILAKTGKIIFNIPGLNKLKSKAKQKLCQAAGSTDYLEAKEMQQTFLNVVNEDLISYLPEITVPTLLIWGENDAETPLKDGQKMHQLIPNSELNIIKSAGHYVFIDQPKEFLDVLLKPKEH